MPQAFASHQDEVHLRGPAGEVPALPVDPSEPLPVDPPELERAAHGATLGSAAGLEHALECLLADSDLSLGLSGHALPADLGPETLVPAPPGRGRHVSGTSTTGAPA